jgi:regulator of protease activity HflC (stomatin/prohibitin superfamily)
VIVEPGYVGVKVDRTGSGKGVQNEVLGTGRYWLNWNEEVYSFPVFQQNYTWTASHHEGRAVDESLTIQSAEGLGINMDLGISYEIDPAKVALIFQKYHKGVEELTDVVLRNAVRDALTTNGATLTVDQIMGAKKADLIKAAESEVKEEFEPVGIRVTKLFLIGEMRPPKSVQEALNSKIEATQRAIQAENEVRQAKAEAEKEIALAHGKAEANRIKQQSLTPQLLQYEMLQVMREKWNGSVPQFMGSGAQSPVPFVNVGPVGK